VSGIIADGQLLRDSRRGGKAPDLRLIQRVTERRFKAGSGEPLTCQARRFFDINVRTNSQALGRSCDRFDTVGLCIDTECRRLGSLDPERRRRVFPQALDPGRGQRGL
jgi:hypothetical protein